MSVTAAEVSDTGCANTRKEGANLQTLVLQRLAFVTQERAAERIGVVGSTLSRFVSEGGLERACQLLAAVGLHLATADAVVVAPDEIRALKRMAVKYLQADLASDPATPTAAVP